MKYLISILFSLISLCCFSQVTPFNRGSSSILARDARIQGYYNLVIPVSNDTTLNGGLDSLGSLIFNKLTRTVYFRDTIDGGHVWTAFSGGGGGGDLNITHSSNTADGNYTQDFGLFSQTWNSANPTNTTQSVFQAGSAYISNSNSTSGLSIVRVLPGRSHIEATLNFDTSNRIDVTPTLAQIGDTVHNGEVFLNLPYDAGVPIYLVGAGSDKHNKLYNPAQFGGGGSQQGLQDVISYNHVLVVNNLVTMPDVGLQFIAGDTTLVTSYSDFNIAQPNISAITVTGDEDHYSRFKTLASSIVEMDANNSIGNVLFKIDGSDDGVLPKVILDGVPTGAGYVLTDVAGNGNLTLEPSGGGSIPSWNSTMNVSPDLLSNYTSNFHAHTWQIDSAFNFYMNGAGTAGNNTFFQFESATPAITLGLSSPTSIGGSVDLTSSGSTLNYGDGVEDESVRAVADVGGFNKIYLKSTNQKIQADLDSVASPINLLWQDVDGFIHKGVLSGGGGSDSAITLRTNGVNNGNQDTLNLQEGTNINITDVGNGTVIIDGADITADNGLNMNAPTNTQLGGELLHNTNIDADSNNFSITNASQIDFETSDAVSDSGSAIHLKKDTLQLSNDNGNSFQSLAKNQGVDRFIPLSVSINDGARVYADTLGNMDIISNCSSVDSIWRVPGIDSFYYSLNGNVYRIKDSSGIGTFTETDPLSVHITDSSSMLANYIRNITLNTPNVLYATPINFSISSHVATGSLTLNTQSPYKLFGTSSSTATPTFIGPIDSNWVSGLHTENYYNTKYLTSNAVSSVSNADGTLTISPTIGAVVASINLAHANVWTAIQENRLITEQLRLSYDASNYLSFIVGSTGAATLTTTGSTALTVTNSLIASSGLQTNATAVNSNLYVTSGQGAANTSNANYRWLSSASTDLRVGIRGNSNSTLTASATYASFIIGAETVTEAASGTHAMIASEVIKQLTVTNAAGATTDMTSLYIEGAPTGITPTNPSTALWVGSGTVKLAVGTTSSAPLNIPAGTLTTGGGIVNGDIQNNGTHFYATLGGVLTQLDNQVTSFGWPLTGTGTGTGATTITYSTPNWLTLNGTYTTTANNQWWAQFSPTETFRATTSDVAIGLQIAPTGIYTANSQEFIAVDIPAIYTIGGFSSTSRTAIRHTGDIYPSATSTYALGLTGKTYTGVYASSWFGTVWNANGANNLSINQNGLIPIRILATNANTKIGYSPSTTDSLYKLDVNGEVKAVGGMVVAQLPTPVITSVTNQGTAGATTYTYKLVYRDVEGNVSGASAAVSTTTGNATLTAGNFNRINFSGTELAGFTAYYKDLYRTAGGATQGKILTLSSGGGGANMDDVGLTGDGSTAPADNNSGTIGAGILKPLAGVHIRAGVAGAGGAAMLFTSGVAAQTTLIAGQVNYDGTDLYLADATNNYKLNKSLSGSATLDFPSTLAGTASDLTVTVTGAADGDVVSIGVPNGSTLTDGTFTAWVSAANTVTIRFANNSLTLALDPASGSFKARVIK